MSQNIEIEFKNMLTKAEYENLLKEFNLDNQQIITQENHYFDTPSFSLKEAASALRIRKKKNTYEMTLKQPAEVGLLETNQTLTEEEAYHAIHYGKLPFGKIKDILKESGIPISEIEYFGSLVTNRAEIEYKNGLLVFDHSIYLQHEDYELEFEAENYADGKQIFQELLHYYRVPERKTENKIRRFYRQKYANQ
ncbi:CYTH domain-containing protein [Neobacillus sp. NRS-1170]|uniref:CYTH domain-containing protein n=1 Tax=Neobacillus sp. NRS-1170 TaxID=3233898 RepID=UPI003D2CC958